MVTPIVGGNIPFIQDLDLLPTPWGRQLFGLFLFPRQKYNLELEFLDDFHIFRTEFCTDRSELFRSKNIASTKSYARLTKHHFPPTEGRFPGPTHLTFLPGKLAGSKLFN